jgi:hypothetical protein
MGRIGYLLDLRLLGKRSLKILLFTVLTLSGHMNLRSLPFASKKLLAHCDILANAFLPC